MPQLKSVHYKEFEKFLIFIGCQFSRQKGSHRIYHRADLKRPIVIPARKQLPISIILNNLRLLNMPKEKYLEIMEQI